MVSCSLQHCKCSPPATPVCGIFACCCAHWHLQSLQEKSCSCSKGNPEIPAAGGGKGAPDKPEDLSPQVASSVKTQDKGTSSLRTELLPHWVIEGCLQSLKYAFYPCSLQTSQTRRTCVQQFSHSGLGHGALVHG